MIYLGRELDVLALWESLGVELASNLSHPLPSNLPLVKCPNPAHDTFKSHFSISTRSPVVRCFAECGITGHVEHAVSVVLGLYDGRSEREARKEARRYILKGYTSTAITTDVVSAYAGLGNRKAINADDPVARDERALRGGTFQFLPQEVRDYLDQRGISQPSRGKWQLGWDEDLERLVIPAYDERNVFRFLIKRSLKSRKRPKYLYTDGAIKTNILFGACFLDVDRVRSDGLVLCEGSLDVIRLHQLGVAHAAAILGSGLSRRQVRLIDKLGPRRVFTFFDRDQAGAANTMDAKFKLAKVPLFVVLYPKHRDDPAEMTAKEVERSLRRAVPIHEFEKRITRKRKVIA